MKTLTPTTLSPPPADQRTRRDARFAANGEKRTRYHLPDALESGSPVGFRTRVSMSTDEVAEALALLSMRRPRGFTDGDALTDAELFEETSLGILSARQSTNFRGHRQVTVGAQDSREVAGILRTLTPRRAPVLDHSAYTHIVLNRPYRTPFTFLLTFIGHRRMRSLLTVPLRAWRKKRHHAHDIPTIGHLADLHIGILADAMERATVIASQGRRRANVHMQPFSGAHNDANDAALEPLYAMCGVTAAERRAGWRIALVAQVGTVKEADQIALSPTTARKLGANLLAFRSERIQPGVNQESKAPAAYQGRQDMTVPDALIERCGRAATNAYVHWTGVERDTAKDRLLLERVDVLSPNGKRRLREIRGHLDAVTDRVVGNLPLWVDLPTGRKLSRSADRGRKAFALAGQRIYVMGLSRWDYERDGTDFAHGVRAAGAACARGALVAELAGVTEMPDDVDLLAGICLMAGPVNQNDVGKQFYGMRDLLADAFPHRDPTSLLVWTLKAKTVADPIGNEEQLLNAARKGALVDLRCAPHEAVAVRIDGAVRPFRQRDGQTSNERAFADVGNFVTDPDGRPIPGNAGERWPSADTIVFDA